MVESQPEKVVANEEPAKEVEETTAASEAASETTAATQEKKPEAPAAEAYEGDLGHIKNTFERDTPIEKKPVPLFAYGNRVRIAALHQDYEPYIDHLVTVAGWARSTRVGGENLFFIELNDGSC